MDQCFDDTNTILRAILLLMILTYEPEPDFLINANSLLGTQT